MSNSSPPFVSATAHHAADPFRLLVESVVDYAIYMVDPDKRIASWNPGAERIYGYRAEEIIGRPFSTVFASDDLASGLPDAVWTAAIASGHHESERRRVRKDGTEFWAIVTVSALRDHFGNHAGFSVVTRDITERKRAEDALRRERDLSDAILSSLPGVYYMYDQDRRFLRWNRRIEIVSGYSSDEFRSLDPLDLFDPADRQRVAERIATVFESGWCEVEADLVAKDGRHIPYYFNGVRTDVDGRRCLLGMGIDVTVQTEAREALRRTSDLLRAVVEGTPDALFVKDLSGNYLLFNPAAARFVGKPAAEVLGRDDRAVFDPEGARIAMAHDRRVIASNQANTEEEQLTAGGLTRTYLATKMPFRDAEGRIVGLLGISRDITEAKRAEERLEHSRAMLRVASRIGRMGAWAVELDRLQVVWSDELLAILELPPDRSPDFEYGIEIYLPDYRDQVRAAFFDCVQTGIPFDLEVQCRTAGGRVLWVRILGEAVRSADGEVTRVQGAFQDISDRRRLEEQYRQAQKMEAVGRLAGGVAHDFNNLLTVISGHSELVLAMPDLGHLARESIKQIADAGERAAALTRQLLGFSRQSLLQPQVLDLNAVVAGTTSMLSRLIGSDIVLTTVLDPDGRRVKVDPSQLDQILINLAVNARDAMPTGGQLTVETRHVELGDDYAGAHLDCRPGAHMMLAMTDTGCGMAPEVMARIFEPFYTTKEVGRGTGLGLAMVFGIVQQSGGCIHVYSEPGRGTTFKIYLPAVAEPCPVEPVAEAPTGLRGSETILLVEDEDGVRGLAATSLATQGYRVLVAADGGDALKAVGSHRGPLDLIVSDVVMPNGSGPELVAKLKGDFPGVRVVYMSGYTDDAVVRHGLIEADVAFIQKPFTPLGLARKVRQVLDRDRHDGGRSRADTEPGDGAGSGDG